MSDPESQEPKKTAKARKPSVPEVSDLSGTEAKPKRAPRKKTVEAIAVESADAAVTKPRAKRVVKKTVEAEVSGITAEAEAKPKRSVRKKVVAEESPLAEVKPGRTAKKAVLAPSETASVASVASAEAVRTEAVKPARRSAVKKADPELGSKDSEVVESSDSSEKFVRPVKRPRKNLEEDFSREKQDQGESFASPEKSFNKSSDNGYRERPAVSRTSVKRFSANRQDNAQEDSGMVVEKVSGLTEDTPVEGLPVRNTRFVRREKGPRPGNRENYQNREGGDNRNNNRREGDNGGDGRGRDFAQKKKDRRGKFKQKPKNRPYGNDRSDDNRREYSQEPSLAILGEPYEVNGLLELAPKGFGFLRTPDNDFDQVTGGIYVSPDIIRRNSLRHCQWIHGLAHQTNRGVQLCELISINGLAPEESRRLPHFEDLRAVNPNKRYCLETTPERYTTRVVDMMAPIGRGQRGLIVAPPRTGKTVLLQHIAEAIVEKYSEEVHLMILLIDERPEEVTEFKRGIKGAEVYASSNDGRVRDHCRLAELCIERAKRLVEAGKHVFILMDSITRLARAYNNAVVGNGRTMSGGIDARALEMPRRLFAAARNTRDAGSLTIIATALIETNSRMDDLIFQEFKGTGNMELVLNRRIAEQYIYPAVDILRSGTRREELILPDLVLDKVNLIRRALAGHRPVEAMERLLFFLHKYPNNTQMLIDLKQRA